MQGLITTYALHICDVIDGNEKDLFKPCEDMECHKYKFYEKEFMKAVVHAMQKLKLITKHGTFALSDLTPDLPQLTSKIRKEAKLGKVSILSLDEPFNYKAHLDKLQREQPILESIREMTIGYLLTRKDNADS